MTDNSHRKFLLCNFYENKARDTWNHNLITKGCDRSCHWDHVLSLGAWGKAAVCTWALLSLHSCAQEPCFGRKELDMPWTTTYLWSLLWVFTGSLLGRIDLKAICTGRCKSMNINILSTFCEQSDPLNFATWIGRLDSSFWKTILRNIVVTISSATQMQW